MAYRANQAFTTWIGGAKRRFKPNDVVPNEIAADAPLLVFDDGVESKPTKRVAKRTAAKSDD